MGVDTGGRCSLISERYSHLGRPTGAHCQGMGASGRLGPEHVVKRFSGVTVGDLHLGDHEFVVKDLQMAQGVADGVVGRDILFSSNVVFDFKADRVEMAQKPVAQGVPFVRHREAVLFALEINGKRVDNMLFDTGASLLSLHASTARELSLEEEAVGDVRLQIRDAYDHILESKPFHVDTCKFGDVVISDFTCHAYDLTGLRMRKGLDQNGILGAPVYDGLRLTFDFDTNLCAMEQ